MSTDIKQELWAAIEKYAEDSVRLLSPVKAQHCLSFAELTGVVEHVCSDERRVEFAMYAIEASARICEGVNNHDNPMTAQDCADSIRALAGGNGEN